MTFSRPALAACVAALSLALTASPALARGGSGSGGGGGGTTAPAPAPAPDQSWTLCPEYATSGFTFTPDGATLFANEIGGIGCLIAKNSAGALSIYEVRSGAGWTPSIKSSDANKLDVQWTNAAGDRHQITVEPGKTVIR
jgi:hypothetical protein